MAKAGILSSPPENAESTLTGSPWRRFLFALGIMVILCAVCAPLFIDRIAADGPKVQDGRVSFSNWTSWSSPVGLGGDWRLVWRSPTSPGGPKAGEVVTTKVPGPWRGLRTPSGGVLPEMGLATYELTISGLKPGSYLLFVPTEIGRAHV